MFDILNKLIIYGIPLILAITLHEAAHGYAALQKAMIPPDELVGSA